MSLFEGAIDATGMTFNPRHQRWTIPNQVGISKLLDERVFNDDDDTPDHAPVPAAKTKAKPKKGRKSGAAAAKARESVVGTLGEALAMDDEELDEDAEGDDEEEEDDEDMDKRKKEVTRPTQISPTWNAIYGQYMLSSASHHGALCESLA
jgi:hypothetical protein